MGEKEFTVGNASTEKFKKLKEEIDKMEDNPTVGQDETTNLDRTIDESKEKDKQNQVEDRELEGNGTEVHTNFKCYTNNYYLSKKENIEDFVSGCNSADCIIKKENTFYLVYRSHVKGRRERVAVNTFITSGSKPSWEIVSEILKRFNDEVSDDFNKCYEQIMENRRVIDVSKIDNGENVSEKSMINEHETVINQADRSEEAMELSGVGNDNYEKNDQNPRESREANGNGQENEGNYSNEIFYTHELAYSDNEKEKKFYFIKMDSENEYFVIDIREIFSLNIADLAVFLHKIFDRYERFDRKEMYKIEIKNEKIEPYHTKCEFFNLKYALEILGEQINLTFNQIFLMYNADGTQKELDDYREVKVEGHGTEWVHNLLKEYQERVRIYGISICLRGGIDDNTQFYCIGDTGRYYIMVNINEYQQISLEQKIQILHEFYNSNLISNISRIYFLSDIADIYLPGGYKSKCRYLIRNKAFDDFFHEKGLGWRGTYDDFVSNRETVHDIDEFLNIESECSNVTLKNSEILKMFDKNSKLVGDNPFKNDEEGFKKYNMLKESGTYEIEELMNGRFYSCFESYNKESSWIIKYDENVYIIFDVDEYNKLTDAEKVRKINEIFDKDEGFQLNKFKEVENIGIEENHGLLSKDEFLNKEVIYIRNFIKIKDMLKKTDEEVKAELELERIVSIFVRFNVFITEAAEKAKKL